MLRSEREYLADILRTLRHISHQIAADTPHPITGFTIEENRMVPLAAGQTATFTATPDPATATPTASSLVWTSSDTTNAPVTPVSTDATGLSATVTFPEDVQAGVVFELTITYTNADGTKATGTSTYTTVAPAAPDVTGFTIAQTA